MSSGKEFTFEDLSEETKKEYEQFYLNKNRADMMGKLMPWELVIDKNFENYLEEIIKLELREDDIWVVTPPKCGTTWMQEIIWLLCNNVDTEAAQINQFYRFPFLEICSFLGDPSKPFPTADKTEENVHQYFSASVEYVKRMPSPRFIKSHLPLEMLPSALLDTCKVVFVARNVKDACVSWFHHHRISEGLEFQGSFVQFSQMFRQNNILFGPFMPQVVSAWTKRSHPNLLFVTYEDMKANLREVIGRLQDFLGRNLEAEAIERLEAAVHIDAFRGNKFVNKKEEIKVYQDFLVWITRIHTSDPVVREGESGSFIRKGMVGDWVNYFTPDLNQEFQNWAEDQIKDKELLAIIL